jgi:microsomal prostaglandin-E synthase 1
MTGLAANPAFLAYAASMIVLALNLLGLWVYSGAVRGKTKTTPNTEDASTIVKGSKLVETEPPEVARVLRAHANAMANILPFALVALVYVLAGASGIVPLILFGVFTLARVSHSLTYLGAVQPWRSASWGLGLATTLVLVGFVARQLLAMY